jgi:hypothetical protein
MHALWILAITYVGFFFLDRLLLLWKCELQSFESLIVFPCQKVEEQGFIPGNLMTSEILL